MRFREMLKRDTDIFLNLDEFGSKHIINGAEYECVIELIDQEKSGNASWNYDGLHGDFIKVYVRECESLSKLNEGESIRVNTRRYTVESVSNEEGILIIMASSYRGRRV